MAYAIATTDKPKAKATPRVPTPAPVSYTHLKADYISAKMAFETAVNELEDTRLTAPFNGYVSEVYIEKFQDVKAAQPILCLLYTSRCV